VLGERVGGAVEPDRGGQGDRAAADPHREEVGVARAAFPEPVGPLDRRPQPGQVGMDVLGRGELGRGQVVGLERGLVEVAEVAGPFPAPGAAGRPPFDQAQGEAGHQRGAGRADHQGDQPAGARAGNGEQERDRPSAAGQRHQVLEPAGKAGGLPADRRRRRDRQLAGGRRPWVRPHRPAHHDAARSGGGPGAHGRHGGTLRPRRRPRAAAAEIVDNRSGPAPQGSMIVWKSYGSRRNPIRSYMATAGVLKSLTYSDRLGWRSKASSQQAAMAVAPTPRPRRSGGT
jgi:hypothetical protein